MQFPLGTSVTLAELNRDPYPIFARLRQREPVTWVPEIGMWFITRHADILQVLNDPTTFTVDHASSVIRDMFGRHMMTTDGPEQVQQKRTCMVPFKPRRLRDFMQPTISAIARELVSKIEPGQVELRSRVTRPLAIRTVMELLGFPPEDVDRISAWYDALANALANFKGDEKIRSRGKHAVAEFTSRIEELLAHPGPSHGSLLGILARPASGFSVADTINNALIIMFGGIETTEGMMGNAIWALLSHDIRLRPLCASPQLMRNAIEETLRWEPSVQSCTRSATSDTAIGGISIPAGATVQCMLGAANRDPKKFDDPNRFDIRRANAREHLSFGAGRHYCLGAPMAYLETETLLVELSKRFGTITLDNTKPTIPTGYEFRKPKTLWLNLGP